MVEAKPFGISKCGNTILAEWWEPYERRRSRTVLRGPRGEIPRGYSPGHLRTVGKRENWGLNVGFPDISVTPSYDSAGRSQSRS